MSNVVSFREAQYSRASTSARPLETADADFAESVSRIAGLQSKAKVEIRRSILMLDLAAQHARQLARRVCDPSVKEEFNARITIIELLLQIAREKSVKL